MYHDTFASCNDVCSDGPPRPVSQSANAILDGLTECAAMPHADTVRIMELMDQVRAQWGLAYPFE